MAEYIDREKVNFRCSYHGDCMGSGSKCDKCSDNVIDYQELMKVPTADVIERSEYELIHRQLAQAFDRIAELDKLNDELRSKINKAIEEIEKTENTQEHTSYDGDI